MQKEKLLEIMKSKKLDAIISEAPQTRLWYTDIATSDGFLIIQKDQATLFVDGRYIEYANHNAKNVEVILLKAGVLEKWLKEQNFKRVGYEKTYLTLSVFNRLNDILKCEYELVDAHDFRIVKSDAEIAKIQKAIDISLAAYYELRGWIKEGMTEKEVDNYLNFLMKKHGADKESFDSIIATDKNSAEPHHHPTNDKIKANRLLKIDFGALYQGYSADITRTIIFKEDENAIGKEKEYLDKAHKIEDIVLEAAWLGRQAIKPGIEVGSVDKICRDYIESKGYGQYFVHSTGHGLGIDVHERPYVSLNDHTILEPGMVITVEPGIYIEGFGGFRHEDDILVTEDGHKTLSRNIIKKRDFAK